jgi:hypothetical protein
MTCWMPWAETMQGTLRQTSVRLYSPYSWVETVGTLRVSRRTARVMRSLSEREGGAAFAGRAMMLKYA